MIDRRTIRVCMAGMASMSVLCILAMGGAFLYDRLTYDHSKDVAFEAQMAEHRAFLAEHQRAMNAYWQERETRRQAREAHEEASQPMS
jgi:hypothetical protein